MTRILFLVALGGALGASLRVLALLVWPAPWGTFAVNVAGSFLIGLLAVPFLQSGRGAQPLASLLIPGVLGGFTTFSAFSLDTLRLVEGGRMTLAAAYILGSVGLSLLACWAGLMLGRLA